MKTADEIRAEYMRPRRPGPETNAYLDALEWVLGASYLGNGYWSDGFEDTTVQAKEDAEVKREEAEEAAAALRRKRQEAGMSAGARQLRRQDWRPGQPKHLECPQCGNTWWVECKVPSDLNPEGYFDTGYQCVECNKIVALSRRPSAPRYYGA